jgi:polar amino acid transport system substrate-binding protein
MRILLGLLMSCALPLSAAPAVVVQVLTEHLPPYQIDGQGTAGGFATELVKQTFAEAGLTYQINFESWSRAYQLAQRDSNTCIYSMSRSPERESLFQWIGELSYNHTALYTMASRADVQVSSLDDARRYVVAVTRDDVTHHYLKSRGFEEGKNLYVLQSISNMLPVLSGRRNDIDLIIVNDTILRYRAQEAGLDATQFRRLLVLPDLPLAFHLACSLKTAPDVVDKLRAGLRQLKADGRFEQIAGQWSERLKPQPL